MADSTMVKLEQAQKNGLKIEEFHQKRLMAIIAQEEKDMVIPTFADEKKIPKRSGTTKLTVRRYLHIPVDLSKHLLQEGVTPESIRIEGVKVSGTVKQYGLLLRITDVTETVHMDDILNVYQPEMARHAAALREAVALEAIKAEGSEHFVGGVTDKASVTEVLNFKALRQVGLALKQSHRKGHKKAGGSYAVVVNYNVMQDLLDDSDLLNNALMTGGENSPIIKGSMVGYPIYDMKIYPTTTLAPTKEGEKNIYTSLLLGDGGYSMITLDGLKWKQTGFEADKEDPLGQRATVGYKSFFGAKVIDPLAVHMIHSISKYDVVADFTKDNQGRPIKDVFADIK